MNKSRRSNSKDDNDEIIESVIYNKIGEEIHIFEGPNGTAKIKEMHPSSFMRNPEQYCPDCRVLMVHKDGFWECDICNHSITDEEAVEGLGYPTLYSTYQEDYGNYNDETNIDKPDQCEGCEGNWPNWKAFCNMSKE